MLESDIDNGATTWSVGCSAY